MHTTIEADRTMTAAEGSHWRRYAAAGVVIISLFFMWGVANNLNDVLIKQFKKAFVLTDLQSGLVQSAFYLGYFLLAMPAALFMRQFGYKTAIVAGLTLYGLGAILFYPAADARSYAFFLCALFVIASGLAFLETAANPLVTVLGPRETCERRLNLAQAFNSLGAISGVLIGRQFILSGLEPSATELARFTPAQHESFYRAEAHAVQLPYLVLGLIVLAWAMLAALVPFPAVAHETERETGRRHGAFAELLQNRRYVFGVVAQFFYVGAQVGVWSFMIRYAQANVPGTGEKTAAAYLTGSLAAFMVGRFAGTAMMSRIRAERLMSLFAFANVALCSVAILHPGQTGLVALAATSFFMSIMFPTIFALSVRDLGGLTKAGSSYLIMAIIGGAILTALMGWISDVSTIATAMVIPALGFGVVALFSSTAK